MPRRIQLQRTKGWRLQEVAPGAVKVDRSTKWGNPHRAEVVGADLAVRLFRRDLEHGGFGPLHRRIGIADLILLRGRDLACWCKPGAPCHADVLLELANK